LCVEEEEKSNHETRENCVVENRDDDDGESREEKENCKIE
jgi:hypothetical protein